jgi:pimeloyl-ACP methyl ester carboxylesterase
MMQNKTKEYFHEGDAKIYYEIAGEGHPLLFVHAGFVDSRMWDEQFAFFAKHYRVIRYDMRGFGKSDPAEAPVVRRFELHHLMQHLQIEKAAVIGCSMGGEIALDLTLEHPASISALVLVSTAPGGFEMQGEMPPVMLEMIGALQQNDLQRASELQLRLWIDGPFRTPDQVNSDIRQKAAKMNQIAVSNMAWIKADFEPNQPLDPPAAAQLSSLQVPALIVAGELDHPEILRAAEFMDSSIPNAQKKILPESAHLPNMEKAESFNQFVFDFLQAI